MPTDNAYVPGFGRWICAGIALAIAISIYLPGTDLPGNGLQWSTEYHEQ